MAAAAVHERRSRRLDRAPRPDAALGERDASVDRLRVTRPDIDTTRFAYAGTSWGGRMGGVMLAIEPRFRVAVLNVAGLSMMPLRPEEDPVNFLPRIHIPVLMLSGKYDSVFPLESSQKPFFRLLGSPPTRSGTCSTRAATSCRGR